MSEQAVPTMALPAAGPDAPTRVSWLRRIPLDGLYGLTAFPLSVVFFVLVVTGLTLGAGLSVLVGGAVLIPVTAYVARAHATVERLRLRELQGRRGPAVEYLRARPGDGAVRRLLVPLRDPQSWLDILWSIVGLITGTAAFSVVVTWWAGTLGGLTYWFWQRWIPWSPDEHGLAWLLGWGNSRRAESWTDLLAGLLFLVTLPVATRLAVLLHASLAGLLLTGRAELQREVARAGAGGAARDAEVASLRRLERDIHDGPQQRLVRLAADLDRARQRLPRDPAGASGILDAALVQARAAAAELWALSRGVAPPLLADRGLAAAVEEMLLQSPVPMDLRLDLPGQLPSAVETTVYFVISEALANLAKHSGARHGTVTVTEVGGHLQVAIGDDGRGGAHAAKGHGLAGLRQRLDAVGGSLDVSSPEGGPTIVLADIPLVES